MDLFDVCTLCMMYKHDFNCDFTFHIIYIKQKYNSESGSVPQATSHVLRYDVI